MAVEFNPENPLGDLLVNMKIRAHGTVTPPATVEAEAHAEGTVTNPESEDA